ncbi:hypothetical protein TNCV_2497071 [Trichonephila clavipes]|nr:hypothetical protein TNCV_2497071 [Trichonephila clavipes]
MEAVKQCNRNMSLAIMHNPHVLVSYGQYSLQILSRSNQQVYHVQSTSRDMHHEQRWSMLISGLGSGRSIGLLGAGGSKFITRKSGYVQLIQAPQAPSAVFLKVWGTPPRGAR